MFLLRVIVDNDSLRDGQTPALKRQAAGLGVSARVRARVHVT